QRLLVRAAVDHRVGGLDLAGGGVPGPPIIAPVAGLRWTRDAAERAGGVEKRARRQPDRVGEDVGLSVGEPWGGMPVRADAVQPALDRQRRTARLPRRTGCR